MRNKHKKMEGFPVVRKEFPDFNFLESPTEYRERIKQEMRLELRKEFFDVYINNELFYQKYVFHLNEVIREKDELLKKLMNLKD